VIYIKLKTLSLIVALHLVNGSFDLVTGVNLFYISRFQQYFQRRNFMEEKPAA
jgi:hypothetical protein